jgi:hypothetical protein
MSVSGVRFQVSDNRRQPPMNSEVGMRNSEIKRNAIDFIAADWSLLVQGD